MRSNLFYTAQKVRKQTINWYAITTDDLRKIKLPVPSIKEQNKIWDYLKKEDDRIEKLKDYIEKLKELQRIESYNLSTWKMFIK